LLYWSTQVVGCEITFEDASVLLVRYDAPSGYPYQPPLLLLKGDGLPAPLRREASRALNAEAALMCSRNPGSAAL
jgi:hypothetical protein